MKTVLRVPCQHGHPIYVQEDGSRTSDCQQCEEALAAYQQMVARSILKPRIEVDDGQWAAVTSRWR